MLSTVAALLGEPARTRILTALLTGRAMTAKELAYFAGVTAATASSHLSRLLAGRLLVMEKQGRCRSCIDWTERRHHISGAVGAALAETFLARRLVARIADSRALSVTPLGRTTLAAMGVTEYRAAQPTSAVAG